MVRLSLTLAGALLAVAAPASAQFKSKGYEFLEAVRDSKTADVLRILAEPGSRIIDTRDVSTGEGAIHIVVKRGDAQYLRYLLEQGADVNLKDGKGNTALMLAVNAGRPGLIDILTSFKANPNLGNSGGETPLIRAVQRRDTSMISQLLKAGADPDQKDSLAGMSARDYAKGDTRAPGLSRLMDEAPKVQKKAVSGPTL